MARAALIIVCLILTTPLGSTAFAQARTVRVAVRVLAPLVEERNGELTGFSVQLWAAIARRLHWNTQYQIVPDVEGQLRAVHAGQADIGVGAISITAQREARVDFSQPILNAGLQILARSERVSSEATALSSLLQLLLSPAVFVWLGIAVLLTIIPAHIVWVLERNQPGGMITSKRYFPGIFRAFYWGLGALATQADTMPRHWLARCVAILWAFTGVVFVAFYTAQLTASLTFEAFHNEINGPADLPGKRVATIRASTAADYLAAEAISTTVFANADEAVRALLNKRVDAFVFDAPVLQYYAAHDGAGHARVVGAIFHAEDYGFAFRNGSDLRKKVDAALLAMREDGEYQKLNEKWFGAK